MAIFMDRPRNFVCVICGKSVSCDRFSPPWPIPPLCTDCELGGIQASGYSYRHAYRREVWPDRRILSQIRALSDALKCEALSHGGT